MVFLKKNNKSFSLLLFGAAVFLGALFLGANHSLAAVGVCSIKEASGVVKSQSAKDDAECQSYCDATKTCTFVENKTPSATAAPAAEEKKVGVIGGIFTEAIQFLLSKILELCGWLLAIAATMFASAIEPGMMSGSTGLLNTVAVRDVWVMVRDLLNMGFILILLFAAFCTIFQVSKWNLKSVWLNILINALLVNFSFPIARFFIDVSNVTFYYFVNHLFTATGTVTGSTIFASLGASSNIGEILAPSAYSTAPIPYTIAMIVVVFLLGMTLLVIAGLFWIRLIALVMLVMFSPIGFVGYIFPATSGFADKWWKNLFSYSFFAPIMIFIIAVALKITEATGGGNNFQTFASAAATNTTSGQSGFVAQAAFLAVPIILLWMGMGIAKSMGIEGADKVVGAVKSGGKWLANAPGKYSGVYGGTKKGWEGMRKDGSFLGMNNRLTRLAFKSGVADREAKFAGVMTDGYSGYKDAKRDIARKGASEIRENWKKAGGASNSELESALNGNQAQRMAAALEMSEKNGFKLNDTDTADQVLARYQNAAKAVANDKVLQNNFNDKVKEKHVKMIIQDEIHNYGIEKMKTTGLAVEDHEKIDIYKKHLDKLSASKFVGQKGLSSEKEAAEYLKNKRASTNRNDKKFVDNVAKDLSNEDRMKFHKNGAPI